jgi:hypothetical protein
MKPETREKIDQAARDWDQANAECREMLNSLQLVDVESDDWNVLFRGLCDEQSKRSAAGDRHAAAMRQSWDEFEEEVKAGVAV